MPDSEWLSLAALVISILSAVYSANRVYTAKKTLIAPLLVHLGEIYLGADNKMLQALEEIRIWGSQIDFDSKFGKKCEEKIKRGEKLYDWELYCHWRFIKGYFNRVWRLHKAGLLTDEEVKIVVPESGAYAFIKWIHPMGKRRNRNAPDEPVEFFKKIFPKNIQRYNDSSNRRPTNSESAEDDRGRSGKT